MTSKKKIKQFKEIVGPALTVDVVVFALRNGGVSVLLLKTKDLEAKNSWVLPGGFVMLNENLDEAAQRILDQKSNININYLEQLYTFGGVNRDTRGRVVTTTYFALVDHRKFNLKTTTAYSEICWFPVNRFPKIGYDHRKIIQKAVVRVRNKLAYSNIVCHLLPPEFTLTQLQKVYEDALGRKVDKRNFRKKILASEVVKETGKRESSVAHRPAKLYKFVSRRYKEIELI